MKLADDSYAFLNDRAIIVRDKSGSPLRAVGAKLNVTERKRAEEALAGQRKELQVILESVPAMIFYKDKENRFLRTNKAFEDAMGLPKEKLQGRSLFDVYPKDMAEAFWKDDKDVMASRKSKCGIVEPMQTSHGTRILQTDKIPYFDESGNVIGVIGFAIDITERTRAEEALKKAHDELERRVEERTAALKKTWETLDTERLRFNAVLDMLPAYVVLLTPDHHVSFANRFFEERFGKSNGRRCYEYLFNRAEPCEICETYTVLKNKKNHHWEWTGPDGRDYDVFDFPFTDVNGSPLILEMGIDVTDRKRAERRRDFTNSLLMLFARKNSSKEYLNSVVEILRQWSGCHALGIRTVDEHGEIPYESCAGFEPGFLKLENKLSLECDACCCTRAISEAFEDSDRALLTAGGSYCCGDTTAFANQLPPEKQARYRGNCMKFGFTSLAIVPIRYRDKVIGAIHLVDRRPDYFTPSIVEFIESIAPLVGETVHRFQTEAVLSETNQVLHAEIAQRERAEEAHRQVSQRLVNAEETERGRISRELHDRLGQDLTGLKLGLQLVRKQGPFTPLIQKSVSKLEQLADGLMRDIHRLAWELHPAVLDDFGLETVLRRYSAEWSEDNNVPVDFHSDGVESHRLPLQLETMLYRVAQEALTNVTRHANAKRVSVLLERRPDHVSLIVEDDGGGFDAALQASAAQGKLGLLGMRERVTLAGGTLEIESAPKAGTTVFVRVPLAQTPPENLEP